MDFVFVVGAFAIIAEVKLAVVGVVAPMTLLFILLLFIAISAIPVAVRVPTVVPATLSASDVNEFIVGTVNVPTTPTSAPKLEFDAIPAPPVTINAPVVLFVEIVELLIVTVSNCPIGSVIDIVPDIVPDKFLYVIVSGVVSGSKKSSSSSTTTKQKKKKAETTTKTRSAGGAASSLRKRK